MDVNQIKILPLLVIVAMMAFSVRLVDFSLGVSSLSGSAFAAKEEKDNAKEMKEEKPAMKVAEASEEKDKMMSSKMASKKAENTKWRDAKDEGAGDSAVRDSIMGDIAARRKMLDQKEQNIRTREAILEASKKELEQKYKELVHLRTQIENLLDKQSEEEQKRIESLVKIYEGMKPKDAARIFDTLDLDVLVSVMSRMSERKLSPILASMNPERARTVTIMLAEEKQLPKLP